MKAPYKKEFPLIIWNFHKKTVALHKETEQERTNMDLTPYTLEELNARIDRAESQIAAGHISSIEDVLQEMDEDFELDEQLGQ